MTKKLAVFDWNGTLFDDADENLIAFNACMRFFGKPEITMEQYRETMDFPLVHVYARNGVHAPDYLENFEEADKTYQDAYLPLAASTSLRRGTFDLLNYLLAEGFDLMVLSNQRIYDLEEQIAARHINQYFKFVSGNESYNPVDFTRVTKRDRFQKFWDEHDYDPSASFIIGDSLEEPEVGKAFGLMVFSVTWGIFSRDRLFGAHSHAVIDELDEVRHYLEAQKQIKVA
jgi:phosphoglycolate phosphatase